MMNIFLVARKEYDIGWGAYSKEFANMNEAVKKIRDMEISPDKIITSPFNDDIEPAKILGKNLGLNDEDVESVQWLIFTKDLRERLPEIIENFISDTEEENIIIVACRAVISALLKNFRENNRKHQMELVIDHEAEFHIIKL
jgi:broad specificity phosphatase PhoE